MLHPGEPTGQTDGRQTVTLCFLLDAASETVFCVTTVVTADVIRFVYVLQPYLQLSITDCAATE